MHKNTGPGNKPADHIETRLRNGVIRRRPRNRPPKEDVKVTVRTYAGITTVIVPEGNYDVGQLATFIHDNDIAKGLSESKILVYEGAEAPTYYNFPFEKGRSYVVEANLCEGLVRLRIGSDSMGSISSPYYHPPGNFSAEEIIKKLMEKKHPCLQQEILEEFLEKMENEGYCGFTEGTIVDHLEPLEKEQKVNLDPLKEYLLLPPDAI